MILVFTDLREDERDSPSNWLPTVKDWFLADKELFLKLKPWFQISWRRRVLRPLIISSKPWNFVCKTSGPIFAGELAGPDSLASRVACGKPTILLLHRQVRQFYEAFMPNLNDRPAAPLYSFMPTCRSGQNPPKCSRKTGRPHLVVHPPGDDGGPVQVDGAGGVVAPVHGHHRYRGCHLCNSAFSADCFYYARPWGHLVARHHTTLARRKVGGKTVPTVSSFHRNLENI